jgi:hypothetical protein
MCLIQFDFEFSIHLGIVQLVRFLVVVELTYADLNPRFNIGVIFTVNYSFS